MQISARASLILLTFVIPLNTSAAQTPATVPLTLPKPTLFAPGVIPTPDFQFNATFTPDGNTVYFSKSDPGFNRITIVRSHRQQGRWTTPEVAPFSGLWKDTDPFVSPDGSKLFFISNRPTDGTRVPRKDYDIWYVERADHSENDWGEARHLEGPVNTEGFELYPLSHARWNSLLLRRAPRASRHAHLSFAVDQRSIRRA